MKECRQTPSNGALFHIFLKKQDSGAWSGSVTGRGIPEPIPFSSLSKMVLVLEELMDLHETLPDTQPGCRAETPDVELEILFRQNTAGRDGSAVRGIRRPPPSTVYWSC